MPSHLLQRKEREAGYSWNILGNTRPHKFPAEQPRSGAALAVSCIDLFDQSPTDKKHERNPHLL